MKNVKRNVHPADTKRKITNKQIVVVRTKIVIVTEIVIATVDVTMTAIDTEIVAMIQDAIIADHRVVTHVVMETQTNIILVVVLEVGVVIEIIVDRIINVIDQDLKVEIIINRLKVNQMVITMKNQRIILKRL